jgi:hypothetical protein
MTPNPNKQTRNNQMRQYTPDTKRRLVRLLRNAIAAIKADAIREPHNMGQIAFLVRRIVTDGSDDYERDCFQFDEGFIEPDVETESFAMLVDGWKNPIQPSAGLLEHSIVEV